MAGASELESRPSSGSNAFSQRSDAVVVSKKLKPFFAHAKNTPTAATMGGT